MKIDRLPRATKSGKNTFGCKIDGKVFTPKRELGDTFGGKSLFRSYDASSKSLMIYAINSESVPNKEIIIQVQPYQGIGEYNVTNGDFSCKYTEIASPPYHYFLGYEGYIKITKDDQQQGVLSGTFSFKAKDDSNVEVNITDGRFDIKY